MTIDGISNLDHDFGPPWQAPCTEAQVPDESSSLGCGLSCLQALVQHTKTEEAKLACIHSCF